MSNIRIPSLYSSAEFLINAIKENCNNVDDLSKISVAVECLLEAQMDENVSPTLKQLLVQAENKTEQKVV
jgi:hypothetical protein